jgi:hypothetical protein
MNGFSPKEFNNGGQASGDPKTKYGHGTGVADSKRNWLTETSSLDYHRSFHARTPNFAFDSKGEARPKVWLVTRIIGDLKGHFAEVRVCLPKMSSRLSSPRINNIQAELLGRGVAASERKGM